MNLRELCDLSTFQGMDSRLTIKLKQQIIGYNNNQNFSAGAIKNQRKKWLDEVKNLKSMPGFTKQKDQYLQNLLHPQLIYTRPKKASYEIVKQPYGKDMHLFKYYENSFEINMKPNLVNFRFFPELEIEPNFLKKTSKQQKDYVKLFHQKFGPQLQKSSPQFWKLLLFDIFKIVSSQKKTDIQIQDEIYPIFSNENAIKFLITFRKQINQYLKAVNFFNLKQSDLLVQQNQSKKKKKNTIKQKSNKFILAEQLTEVDFLKMKDHELILKVPTLRKSQFNEYIHFRIQPMPKFDHKVQPIVIADKIDKNYIHCFQSAKLNTIQSMVFDFAYNSSQNMLVCAPTGAGKTNIATLTIINVMIKYKDDFKIIYISPMKALANQLVNKFTKKFPKHNTREMTGDIQLSQKQLATTHIIVTTPQKLDVVTRKNSSLMEEVKLVILDQVHLLNDQRGWVLQSIIARLFRSVQRTQRRIRILGLSATLPNYIDVATFLKVDVYNGLFHFDNTYRPVPLLLNFVGIKNVSDNSSTGRKRRPQQIFNQRSYQMAISHIKKGKQVLIFVHSRRQTVQHCKYIQQRAKQYDQQHLFKSVEKINIKYKLQDKDLNKVVTSSLGFHHAGMVRADRNQVEKMFEKGDIKILVATATLAWGVNLPAYAVIIKGTDIYDPNLTEARDLSILDVQQMFGRAGRPQYDTNGQAVLMTEFKKVNKYMGALTNTAPIQSRFCQYLKQSLNAEICSGTVTNEYQAFEWIKYTFFSIRCLKNPIAYGCKVGINENEQQFYYEQFLRNKIVDVIKELDKIKLIRYDHKNYTVSSTQLGRVTSHFYIKCDTMQHFCSSLHININNENPSNINKKFDYKTDLQILNILANSKQFDNIKVRNEQYEELKGLINFWIFDEKPDFGFQNFRGGSPQNNQNYQQQIIIQTPQKVLLLIQGYLKDLRYQNYSLTNDTQYIIQNGIRLLRCLLDLCTKKNQAMNVQIILKWCKYIENRMYANDSPLIQFSKYSYTGYNSMRVRKNNDGYLSRDFYQRFVQTGLKVNEAIEMEPLDFAGVLGTKHARSTVAQQLLKFCKFLPRIQIEYKIKPIAQTILKIDVLVYPKWEYSSRWHLKSEVFWVFFDDQQEILHSESFTIDEEFVRSKKPCSLNFFIPYRDNNKKLYRLSIRSDRWIMDQQNQQILINLSDLGIVMDTLPFTQLLNLQPLPKTALKNQLFEGLYKRFNFFNPIQTQLFYSLYHTNQNILIGAPTGSGKTIMSQLAILNLFLNQPQKKIVYIAPLKSLAKQRLIDWVPRFQTLKKSVVELTGDYTPDLQTLNKAHIIITTPEKWDGITRNKDRKYTQNVGLVIFDQIHLLGQDRGAVIQVIVSRMNKLNKQQKVRMIGLSTAMANGSDVAQWFGSGKYGFFNFKPSVRPVPIEIYFEGFSEKNYCPRMATMNKPAYNHIKKFSDGKPVLIFVSSRRQTRLTALDLIALASQQKKTTQFIKCNTIQIQNAIQQVSDEYLKQTLSFGIGMHHAGLNSQDRKICQQLFVQGKIQLLIATSTLAWGVNFPARLVIIKGTEYFDPKTHRYVDFPATDLLQMIGRAGRPQFDDKGVAVVYCQQSKKNFYRRYLNDPFPIESSLIQQIDDHINAQIARGQITNKQECIDWFTWSYAFRRILKNPNFYGIQDNNNQTIKKFLMDLVEKSLDRLQKSNCIEIKKVDQGQSVYPTQLGFIASNYYLKHQTVKYFNETIKPEMTFVQMLYMISHAQQFLETPLRHNEDNFNQQLSQIAPYKIKKFGSPQDKTFLLFQMHFFNLPAPIRDYVTDAKLIIDASVRVVMGATQICRQKQFLNQTLLLIQIQQLLFQGCQCNIPWISQQIWSKIQKKYPPGLAHLVENISNNKFKKQFLEFLKANIQNYNKNRQHDILEYLSSVPKIKLTYNLFAYNSEKQQIEESWQITQDIDQAVVEVNIKKQNECSNKLLIQKQSKVKQVSWILIIGDQNNKLLSLKRIFLKKQVTVKAKISLPQFAKNKLNIYLLSDSYVGLDQQYSINLEKYLE